MAGSRGRGSGTEVAEIGGGTAGWDGLERGDGEAQGRGRRRWGDETRQRAGRWMVPIHYCVETSPNPMAITGRVKTQHRPS